MTPKENDNCLTCKYYRGTNDNGTTKCGNRDQWNTWIKPQEGCKWWKEEHNDNQHSDHHSGRPRHLPAARIGQARDGDCGTVEEEQHD